MFMMMTLMFMMMIEMIMFTIINVEVLAGKVVNVYDEDYDIHDGVYDDL